MYGDEIWDEERWERFLRENDKRVDRYMDLLFAFMVDHAPPDGDDAEAVRGWEDKLRAFLWSHGFRNDDVIFPFSNDAEAEEPLPLEEDAEPLDGFWDLPVYGAAFHLATEVLQWSNALPGDLKDSTLVQFCSHLTQIPAHLAKGHGIGYEQDALGGNIACVKRALGAANAALDLLRETKPEAYMDAPTYRRLYEQTYELRNALGLYVQELRARFDLGID